ncbi:MAG TPA: hypothetical protein VGX46_00115 [Vicinamibacterales bacterium]|nr:hypothetical protein [Vicinamibacterales bacterium]
MPDTDGSLDSEVAQAARPAPRGLTPRTTLILTCLFLMCATGAAAQQPLVSEKPPATPEFFSRFDFHLNAAWLGLTSSAPTSPAAPSPVATSPAAAAAFAADHRYSFDTHWGGSLDFVDYVVGRTSFIIDYEAILGDEFRLFDPNQGIYTLEAASSARVGDAEVVGIFHHTSRHLADRANQQAVAWNAAGVRFLKRVTREATTIDVDAELSGVVAKAFVDYTWIGELHLLVRHPLSERVGVFAQGSGKLFAVDGTVPNRGTQTGGVVEVGVHLKGTGGALELFAGFEKRVDAYELERDSQRWLLAGFRLLSR